MTKEIERQKDTGLVTGRYRIITKKSGTDDVIRETDWIENLVMAGLETGVGLLTKQLAGDTSDPLPIDSASIGTGSTAPSITDTDLETSVLSGIITTSEASTATTVTINFFITDGQLANNTYTEFGIFCNNKLFARSIISPSYTKASGEDTTIVYEITFATS